MRNLSIDGRHVDMASFIANNGTRAGVAGALWGRGGQVGRATSTSQGAEPMGPAALGPGVAVAGLLPTRTHNPRSPGGLAGWRARPAAPGLQTWAFHAVSGPQGGLGPHAAPPAASMGYTSLMLGRCWEARRPPTPPPPSPAPSPCPALCLQAALLSGTSATGPGVRTGARVSVAGTRTCASAHSALAARTASKVSAGGWVPGAPASP